MAVWLRCGRKTAQLIPVVLSLLTAAGLLHRASAQVGSARYASVVEEASSGRVLEDENADALRRPASLAKLMTLYLTFEAVRDRRITLDRTVPVSAYAASMQPSKLGLVPGAHVTVEDAILALVTKSANDAAAALGELLGGTEQRFAQMMTLRARALGMSRSTFTNASGLPDPEQWSTARDLALLARRLISDFPEFYHYFDAPSFIFHRQVVFNHDSMIKRYPGADGLKTGYTEASGHNLVTSAVRGGVRLVGVEFGCATNAERDAHMAALLDAAYAELNVPNPDRGLLAAAQRAPSLIPQARAAELERRPVPRWRESVPVHTNSALSRWTIQVGSFGSPKAARVAAEHALRIVEGGEVRVEHASFRGRRSWRAQIAGLSQSAASGACGALSRHRAACVVLRPEPRQIAAI